MFGGLCRPVAACGSLKTSAAADQIPLYIKISDPGGLDLNVWCLDAWMLTRLEWIGGGDGGDGILGEGIGRNSNTLKLQELGGFQNVVEYMNVIHISMF